MIRINFKLAACLLLPFCLVDAIGQTTQREPWPRETEQPDAPKPKDVPRQWRDLIGEYGPENEPIYVLENAGDLSVIFTNGDPKKLDELKPDFEPDKIFVTPEQHRRFRESGGYS